MSHVFQYSTRVLRTCCEEFGYIDRHEDQREVSRPEYESSGINPKPYIRHILMRSQGRAVQLGYMQEMELDLPFHPEFSCQSLCPSGDGSP